MKHRKTPCAECPFSRKVEPGTLGGSPPQVYIGQISGPFWLPCHCDSNYAEKESTPDKVGQCAGAAIFRANIGLKGVLPESLTHLDADTEASFSSFEEFVKHHLGEDVEITEELINYCLWQEMQKAEVKYHTIERP